MTITLTRVRPGVYADPEQGIRIYSVGADGWQLVINDSWVTTLPTKKACVTAAEVELRKPQDRTVSDTLQLFRRSLIKPGTQLTIEGIRGKCAFQAYTRKDDGSEWIDVIAPGYRSRTVRPERIKRVHRK